MDSREPPRPPPLSAPSMMVGPTSYHSSLPYPNTSPMISHNSTPTTMMAPATARFPFNAVAQPQPPAPSNPSEFFNNNSPYDGSSSASKPCGFDISASSAKKKRGRPRKYSPDGNIALGLAPTHVSSSAGHGDSSGTPSTEQPSVKKHRGRPPGSGKKQLDALGAGGIGFTPHVILVKEDEDVAAKIVAFSQQGPRTVTILSAHGAVRNVTLRQPEMSGGTVTFEGQFEIISLSGSFQLSESNGSRTRTGGLSISLAGNDGRVLGGGVSGVLTAASQVQVIVGSFVADGKKPSAPPPQTLTFGTPLTPTSPTSQGPSTESSEDNDHSRFGRGHGLYNNASQPIHNMPMYVPSSTMGWPNSAVKM